MPVIIADDQGCSEFGAEMDFASRKNPENKFSDKHPKIGKARRKPRPCPSVSDAIKSEN